MFTSQVVLKDTIDTSLFARYNSTRVKKNKSFDNNRKFTVHSDLRHYGEVQ